MFLVAGWLLACYVSSPAVLLLGRGPLGGWAYSVVARVRGVRCACCVSPALSRMFALAILMVGRSGVSRLAARVGDCSIVSARLVT